MISDLCLSLTISNYNISQTLTTLFLSILSRKLPKKPKTWLNLNISTSLFRTEKTEDHSSRPTSRSISILLWTTLTRLKTSSSNPKKKSALSSVSIKNYSKNLKSPWWKEDYTNNSSSCNKNWDKRSRPSCQPTRTLTLPPPRKSSYSNPKPYSTKRNSSSNSFPKFP